ncbi:phenylalanine--tRNA ligase subunit alpha [Spiroplasma culicicola]|uniref:Phenylalanine--tRNA ligase alpha subunit n=1 Tax=Spiroplasma culicicola AES-1 TaxID=1276246 RepID=W6AHF9_9MOLU|nr:phenylalanine--tRNA ligase subunit alpha [Spiroplasma culicicola]AHI53134.1 phenylalanyl-tRNA synthetase subunit alpha [Spiroplasma culicicola AES-1]
MVNKLNEILKQFNQEIKTVNTKQDIEELKKVYAGKDSPLNEVLKNLKSCSPEEKKEVGITANNIKSEIFAQINTTLESFKIEELKKQLENEKVDLSMPGMDFKMGSKHPLNLVIEEVSDIFRELGYEMVDGTEFETDEYCFQKLNLPIGHPARDMQDTFYIDQNTVLRTHSTNMTARMLTQLAQSNDKDKHIAAISFGNVYRRDDDDATHSHQFMQIDGFAVGKKISFANLKWVLEYMCKRLFSQDTQIRMRPSFFPFTEPSVEVDITCITCKGKGCKICKLTGWIEILGSGMLAPEVIELNGLDPNEVGGLAFGIGIERVAMLKFGIKNIRDFYENDVRFLNQFKFFGN